MMHAVRRRFLLPVTIALLGLAAPAEAGAPDRWQDALGIAGDAIDAMRAKAEQAILLGGALLYENRHTVAGALLGCAAGSAVGATSSAALAPVTGGAALAGAGSAALIGCGVGAVVGAQIGYPLDHVFEEQ